MSDRSLVLFLSPDLSRNATYTPFQFAGALQGTHPVAIAGPASGAPWPPMAEEIAEGATVLPSGRPRDPGVADLLRPLAERAGLLYPFKAMPSSLGLALACRDELGIPVALHLDDWDAGFFAGHPVARRAWYALRSLGDDRGEVALRRMERRVREVDAVTVSSRRLQERFGGTVVRQGVDPDHFDPARYPRDEARRRIGLAADAFVALYVGTPAAHKGAEVLTRLGRKLHPHGVVVVVAPGNDWVPSGPGVARRGAVPFAASGWVLAAADVFVLPQQATPFAAHQTPAKLLHALAMGLPVVATDVGDAREILEGDPPAGVVVPAGDDGAFEQAVLALRDDTKARAALGREARTRATERYGWPAMARRLEEALGSLLPPVAREPRP